MLWAKSNDNNDKGGGRDMEEMDVLSEEEVEVELDLPTASQALMTTDPPEVFSDVPVLAIGRNPLFPRFVKMLEVPGCLMLFTL